MNPTLNLCLALLLPWVAAHALPQQAVSLQRQDQTSSLRWLMRPRLALAGVRPSSRPVPGVQRPGLWRLHRAVAARMQVAGRDRRRQTRIEVRGWSALNLLYL